MKYFDSDFNPHLTILKKSNLSIFKMLGVILVIHKSILIILLINYLNLLLNLAYILFL